MTMVLRNHRIELTGKYAVDVSVNGGQADTISASGIPNLYIALRAYALRSELDPESVPLMSRFDFGIHGI